MRWLNNCIFAILSLFKKYDKIIAIDLSKQQVPDVAPKAALRFFITEYRKKKKDTIFINSKNIKASYPNRLLLTLKGKINLKKSDKYIASSNLSVCYTWENVKKLYKNNKLRITAPTWNDKFELPHGFYSVSDIQNHLSILLQ